MTQRSRSILARNVRARGVTIGVMLSAPALVLLAACGASEPGEDALTMQAREIHERVITLDTHVDIPFTFATEEVDPGVRGDYQNDLPKMRDGGLDAAFFIVYMGQRERTPEGYDWAVESALTKFDAIHRMTDELYPDQIELAYTADDVERIHGEGKLVAAIGIENGFAIGTDLSRLEQYHELGGRYMTLAHNGHNDIADSATPDADLGDEEAEHGGLSEFGREVVAEMNRLGIMVDVSHISKDAMMQAASLSGAPVIASHSSTKAFADHRRNMDDEQLLAMRDNGGVVQTVALGSFVKVPPPERDDAVSELRDRLGISGGPGALSELSDEARAEYEADMAEIEERFPSATLADFVDHVDHAVGLIGIDHVGISSDFDGGGGVDGWSDSSETFNVTLELVRRGYTEEEIRKLWGDNLLRVWREVEQAATELQAQVAAYLNSTGVPAEM